MSDILTPNNSSVSHPIKLKFWNVCRPNPSKHACTNRDAFNRKARALWGVKHSINKHFYAYSSQTKAPRVLQIYAHAQIINVYKHKGSHWNRGKASCWKWALKFTLHPMEFWAGKRKYPNNSINSQQTGALFIGFIGLREVHFCAKLYGAACSTSKDIRTWNESVGLACWTKRSKDTKGDLHRSGWNWYLTLS